MSDKTMIIMGVFIAATLIILGSYVILEDKKPVADRISTETFKNSDEHKTAENNNTYQNNSVDNVSNGNHYVEATTETITPETIREMEKKINSERVSDKNITQNTKPSFNVGEEYVYENFVKDPREPKISADYTLTFLDHNEIHEYRINDKIKVDNAYYFKIQTHCRDFITAIQKDKDGSKPIITPGGNSTIYINADTGEIFRNVETSKEIMNPGPGYWYNSWMLALEDNLVWQIREDVILTPQYKEYLKENFGEGYDQKVVEFSVKGREKINERECFTVEEDYKICSKNGACKIESKNVYCIDVEKRILLKSERWYLNLREGSSTLIDQNVWKTSS